MIKQLCLLVFLCVSVASYGATSKPQIDIISDLSGAQGQRLDEDISTNVLMQLITHLATDFQFTFRPAQGEWDNLMLERYDNVCLYNKAKTSARQANAVFSQFPMTAYPANSVIVHQGLNVTGDASLSALVNKGLKIGFLNGHEYGGAIDQQIAALGTALIAYDGVEAEAQLLSAFEGRALDGIVTFVDDFLQADVGNKLKGAVSYYPLTNNTNIVHGYFACSKSALGEQIIALFDRFISSPKMQQFLVDEHQRAFTLESDRLIADLTSVHTRVNN